MRSKVAKIIATILFLAIYLDAQAQKRSFFKDNSYHRINLGLYHSYFNDNVGVMTAGYDYGLELIRLRSGLNLIDVGVGANIILAYDGQNDPSRERPDYARIVPGLEINWSVRLYFLPIKKIDTRMYLEALPITFVCYAKPYPDGGSRINIGSHVGLGIDYRLNSGLRGFASLRLMHTSNGREYERNPALNAIGITTGVQF